jgi:aminocarboxymuconate-semialdehyde decarboxylase
MTGANDTSRREFLGALGAGVAAAGSLTAATEAAAQGAAPLKIVDFHNHYMGPSWTLTNLANVPPAARPAVEALNRNLQSQDALLSSVESAGIAARVINTPTAFIEDADGKIPPGAIERINDQMAELAGKHPGKLYGLATVDAFSGDTGARELTRAVKELKLRGVFVESAKRDLVLGAKESRPTLATAAALGVPVFVHPLTDPALHKRFSGTGRMGVRLARGTINNAALISMLEDGTFDEASSRSS